MNHGCPIQLTVSSRRHGGSEEGKHVESYTASPTWDVETVQGLLKEERDRKLILQLPLSGHQGERRRLIMDVEAGYMNYELWRILS